MPDLVWALIVIPLIVVVIDGIAGIRSRNYHASLQSGSTPDFEVLVPIYGNIRYLENTAYLSGYGSKVTLCTTGGESQEFYEALTSVAEQHGFRTFRSSWVRTANPNRRATSGTIRDRLIRDAVTTVKAPYVIPLDADTTTSRPLDELAGGLQENGYDIASVRLVPTNSDTLLAKLQQHEYRLAMRFRLIAPWLISGACHVAKTPVLRDIMERHSLFFQGNDVEVGLIAATRGYKVGHLSFDVLTEVPGKPRAWFRQRLAWAGGEFRLFIVNCRFAFRHPFLWIYGGLIAIIAFPLRWYALSRLDYSLLAVLALYYVLVLYLHWKTRNVWLIVLPFYTLFSSIIMTPLGIIWYFVMASKDRNAGIIRPFRSLEERSIVD